jgi:hypothetical protein
MKEEKKIYIKIDEDLLELAPAYLENRRRDIAAIKGHLESGRFEAICSIGHSMKGSGGGYGFYYISKLGAGLERAAARADSAAILNILSAMSLYLERVVPV